MSAVIFLFSCNDLVPPTRVDPEYDTLDLSEYFPLEIGNVWRYEQNGGILLTRTIDDTLHDIQNNRLYKASFGIGVNTQNEYYYWDELGLHLYLCGIEDTCRDVYGNGIEPLAYLSLKNQLIEGESWQSLPGDADESRTSSVEMIDSLIHSQGTGVDSRDTTLENVAEVTTSWSYGTNPTLTSIKQYGKGLGLIRYVSLSAGDTISVLSLVDYSLQ